VNALLIIPTYALARDCSTHAFGRPGADGFQLEIRRYSRPRSGMENNAYLAAFASGGEEFGRDDEADGGGQVTPSKQVLQHLGIGPGGKIVSLVNTPAPWRT